MKRCEIMSIFLVIAASVAISGCDQLPSFLSSAPKPKGTIVASVDNNYFITQEQLDKEIENINAINALYFKTEAKKFTKEEKMTFLQETLIPKYLLFKEALAKKIDQQADSKEALFNYEVQILSEEYLKRETGGITATPQEIEAFYNQYKDRFRQDEERRIREIMVPTEDEAKEILIDLLKGADFAATAQSRSKADSAAKGGDLGYIKKGQLGDDYTRLSDTAFSLEKGQISPVFKDKKGYYLLRIEDIKGGQLTPLNEVWDQVKSAVIYIKQQQKLQELKDTLSKKSKIEVYQEKVK
jgi:peptidyl-prolyl cis-trans isomerase C